MYDKSIYDAEWFAGLAWQHPIIERLLGCLVGATGRFASVLDLGAGDGWWAHVMHEMGSEAIAVEVSEIAAEVMPDDVQIVIHDLREPLDLEREFELILCIEVAEHLPASAADTLCDTIARHCGRCLLFTAAVPGQGGHGHINCQPCEYWIAKLQQRGLVHSPEWSNYITQAWRNILGSAMPWLSYIMIFWRAA